MPIKHDFEKNNGHFKKKGKSWPLKYDSYLLMPMRN